MEIKNPYSEQVSLLTAVLPAVGKRSEFALKGGTAINLFLRNMPRLSVDIDLVYLPLQARAPSLAGINQGLLAIATDIERIVPNTTVQTETQQDIGTALKLVVRRNNVVVKVEVSPVVRGHVLPIESRGLCPAAESQYGMVHVPLLAFEEIYAGKLCAALDRQHPRDLYDVHTLLRNEGISESLKNVFLVYLMGSGRPLAELLDPTPKDIRRIYEIEFEGMTFEPIAMEDLVEARRELIRTLHARFTDADRRFLLDFKQGKADWGAFIHPHAKDLPAIRWKVLNLNKMDKMKRQQAVRKLEQILTTSPTNV